MGPYCLVSGCRLQPNEYYFIVDMRERIIWSRLVDFNPQHMYGKNILLSIYGTLFFLLFIYLCVYLFLIYHVLVCLFLGYCFILFHCFIPTGLGICLFRLNFIYIRYL
jgi:hypothetical protein